MEYLSGHPRPEEQGRIVENVVLGIYAGRKNLRKAIIHRQGIEAAERNDRQGLPLGIASSK
jgi:hypothetical protein